MGDVAVVGVEASRIVARTVVNVPLLIQYESKQFAHEMFDATLVWAAARTASTSVFIDVFGGIYPRALTNFGAVLRDVVNVVVAYLEFLYTLVLRLFVGRNPARSYAPRCAR